jgi:hypothetical protein
MPVVQAELDHWYLRTSAICQDLHDNINESRFGIGANITILSEVLENLFDADGLKDTHPEEPALFGEGIPGEDMRKNPTRELDFGITVPNPTMPLKFRIEMHHVVLQPDKDNVMGYYPFGSEPFHITPQRGQPIRWAVLYKKKEHWPVRG